MTTSDSQSDPAHPFLSTPTDKPLVAKTGQRKGYILLAPSQETLHYETLSEQALLAARAWAIRLEAMGAPRAYWITLSEVTRHLHIHLFPRWPEDALSGVPLFESRDTDPQPAWDATILAALQEWAAQYQVEIL